MKILSKFSCVQRHNKYHTSEYSTHIIQKCIQELETEVYA